MLFINCIFFCFCALFICCAMFLHKLYDIQLHLHLWGRRGSLFSDGLIRGAISGGFTGHIYDYSVWFRDALLRVLSTRRGSGRERMRGRVHSFTFIWYHRPRKGEQATYSDGPPVVPIWRASLHLHKESRRYVHNAYIHTGYRPLLGRTGLILRPYSSRGCYVLLLWMNGSHEPSTTTTVAPLPLADCLLKILWLDNKGIVGLLYRLCKAMLDRLGFHYETGYGTT